MEVGAGVEEVGSLEGVWREERDSLRVEVGILDVVVVVVACWWVFRRRGNRCFALVGIDDEVVVD